MHSSDYKATLAASLGGDPDAYVNTREAARLCGVSASILNKRRLTGDLPRYFQPPGLRRVLYRIGDLRDWLEAGKRTSTSEAGAP
jgi:hypothetical protein